MLIPRFCTALSVLLCSRPCAAASICATNLLSLHGSFSTLICCVFGWLCSWGLLYSARDLENRSIVELTDDEKSDRSIMPLAWCSLPAGALAGAVWYVAMHGIPTVIEVARGMQVEGT